MFKYFCDLIEPFLKISDQSAQKTATENGAAVACEGPDFDSPDDFNCCIGAAARF
jgi:hypothetical protein